MNSNVQFHNNLNLLSQQNSYIEKNKGLLIVKLSDNSNEKKMTTEKINMIMFFLIENKPYIEKADAKKLTCINERLIESAGNDNKLKNKINSTFSALLQNRTPDNQNANQEIFNLEFQKNAAESTQDPYVEYLYAVMLEQSHYMELARTYYELAARKGLSSAQQNYADMLYSGIGGRQDLKKARYNYHLAADQGLDHSQENYAKMAEDGIGGDQNFSEALHYYKLAADQGSMSSQERYAEFREAGIGDIQDFEEAFKYYKLAAGQGSISAQEECGMLLESGKVGIKYSEAARKYKKEGVLVDFEEAKYKEARKYYKLPAERGSAFSQNRYGTLLLTGKGGAQDIELGSHYLKLAADQGSHDAILDYIMLVLVKKEDSVRNDKMIRHYQKLYTKTPEYKKLTEGLNKASENVRLKHAADTGSYNAILDYITNVLLENKWSVENNMMIKEYGRKIIKTPEYQQLNEKQKKEFNVKLNKALKPTRGSSGQKFPF